MDFDFLDRQFRVSSTQAIRSFRNLMEITQPSLKELEQLSEQVKQYPHTTKLPEEFSISGVDGSGEFPVLQQDDLFIHFATAAGATYRTQSRRQHKLSAIDSRIPVFKEFVVLADHDASLRASYRDFVQTLTGLSLSELVENSDYCEVFSQIGKQLTPAQIQWPDLALSKASQLGTHAYLLRSLSELGMAIRMLAQQPRYLLLDTTLVYFLLGETVYLPEILKRYLIKQAAIQGTAVVAINKSHNVPGGDLISRTIREKFDLRDHWYLRLPAPVLDEPIPAFLSDKEIPPKLSISYLFKFEATPFPLRMDLDASWWSNNLNDDAEKEKEFFGNLDFTCHEVRSFGYPYPMHAAHRSASLTKQERRALRDILVQQAQQEGLLRHGALDPEQLHMRGM